MKFFNKDKTTISLLKKECKRLERERNDAYAKLESIKKYQADYEELLEEVHKLKDKYAQLIQQNESITKSYKEELEKITKAK